MKRKICSVSNAHMLNNIDLNNKKMSKINHKRHKRIRIAVDTTKQCHNLLFNLNQQIVNKKILTIGDGNLSFSRALTKLFPQCTITATTYDSYEVIFFFEIFFIFFYIFFNLIFFIFLNFYIYFFFI